MRAPTLRLRKGLSYEMDTNDNPTFRHWMARVEQWRYRAAGISVYDLPDCDYRTWYDERLRPIRAANRALRRA